MRALAAAAQLALLNMTAWGSLFAPKILVQPQSQTAPRGSAVTFTVSAAGTDLMYSWWGNGVLQPSGPDASYSIADAQAGDGGSYQVVIANQLGQVASTLATLKVVDAAQMPPTISAVPWQCIDKNTSLGPVSFSITGGSAGGNDLALGASSSNTNLVPAGNINFSGEGTNRAFTLVPAADQSGSCLITLSVTDTNGNSAATPFELVVNATNVPPEFVGTLPYLAQPFELYSATVSVTDANPGDRDHLQVSALVLPEWLQFDPSTRVLSGTPPPGGPEGDEVVLQVEDGVCAPVTNQFRIWTADVIGIGTAADVAAKRQALIEYIWGAEGWPTNRVPSGLLTNVSDWVTSSIMNEEGNLARIDWYLMSLPYGLSSAAYHYHPIHGNGELVIFHGSHNGTWQADDLNANNAGAAPGLVIPALLKAGYSVLALSMPINGLQEAPTVNVPGQGEVTLKDHCDLFRYLERPYRLFLEPIVVALNYAQDQYHYQRVFMTGLSGGGWTTTVYAALDERITGSFPVAGSIPNYLRVGLEGLGDCEQDNPGFYRIANYKELYVMGAYGANRMQGQILNRYDGCCFYGLRQSNWVAEVQSTVQSLGQGRYEFYLDETHHEHKTSPYGLSLILNALPPTLEPPVDVTVAPGAGEQTLTLSGIGKAARTQGGELRVWAQSEDEELIGGLQVDYTSGERSAQLRFSPSSTRVGTATIEVTVAVSTSELAAIRRRFKVKVEGELNQAPLVRWLSPTNGTVLPAPQSLGLQVEASDADGAIAQVEFRDGTNTLGVVSGAPYQLIWTNATVGSHNLSAVATDDRGSLGFSSSISITVLREPATHTPLVIQSPRLVTATAPRLQSAAGLDYREIAFRIEGPGNGQVIIEVSNDLATWTPVRTNTLINGVAIIADHRAADRARRFYRARLEASQ